MAALNEAKSTPQVESKEVFGSHVLFLNGRRLNKFPVQRPLAKSVLVFSSSGIFVGRGVGAECKRTGICICVDGKNFDSNHELLWQYE